MAEPDARLAAAGRSGDLWNLQKAIAETVGQLERFDLPELDWTEETETFAVDLFDDLGRLKL